MLHLKKRVEGRERGEKSEEKREKRKEIKSRSCSTFSC
jgi:hypothetical protein